MKSVHNFEQLFIYDDCNERKGCVKMLTTNKVFWFSKRGFSLLNDRYEQLKKQKELHYINITKSIQMDHHDDDLSLMIEKHTELKNMMKQIEAIRPFIQLYNVMPFPNTTPEKVMIGTTVTIQLHGKEDMTYEIAGYGETDLAESRIAYTTELAQQLLGKMVDEEFSITHHDVTELVRIIAIDYR